MRSFKRWSSLLLAALTLLTALIVAAPRAEAEEAYIESSVVNRLEALLLDFPVGKVWKESTSGLGTQCYGFAARVIYEIFGDVKGNYPAKTKYRGWNTQSMGGLNGMMYVNNSQADSTLKGIKKKGDKGFTKADLATLLSRAKPGDVIQCTGGIPEEIKKGTSGYIYHTMLVWNVDTAKKELTIYDCNWYSYKGLYNTLRRETYSFDGFYNVVKNRGDIEILHATNYKSVMEAPFLRLNSIYKQVALGTTAELTATVSGKDMSGVDVLWTSSVPAVATVDGTGKITVLKTGETTITAKTADGKCSAECTIKVVDAIPATSSLTATVDTKAKQVALKWTAVSGAKRYLVQRRVKGETEWKKVTNTTGKTHTDTVKSGVVYEYRVRAGKDYTYAIKAGTASGTVWGYGSTIVETNLAPAAPKTVTAAATETAITVTWSNVAIAERYGLQRKVADGSWKTISSYLTDRSYVDTDVEQGTSYQYRVRAYRNGWGSYTASSAVKLVPVPPAAPASLTVTPDVSVITVKWAAVSGAKKYALQRREVGGDWKTLNAKITGKSYKDKTVEAGKIYQYRVKAYVASWGSYATTDQVSPLPAAPKKVTLTATKGDITVKWSAVTGATKYALLRREAGGDWVILGDELTSRTYVDDAVEPGKKYEYGARAYFRGWGSATISSKGMLLPEAPESVALTVKKGYITVKWTAVDGATKYTIQRKEGSGSWKTLSSSATGTSYKDKTVKAGKTYQYRVKAQNVSGAGSYTAAPSKVKAK